MYEIEIDGIKVEVEEGERLLTAATRLGSYIPHLCSDDGMDFHPAACRLCWVELAGEPAPTPACATRVQPGMVVKTRSPRVDRLVRSGFELLLSIHRLECKVCPAKDRCGLLELSRQRTLPLRNKRLTKLEPNWPVDRGHPGYGLDPNKCVLCGKCVHVANHVIQTRVLDFHRRGLDTTIATFDHQPLAQQDLTDFDRVVAVCPVGALFKVRA